MNLLKQLCISALLSLMVLMIFPITNASAASGIRISCDKDDAEVYVDGKIKGNCPVDVKVKEGKHKVVIKKDNGDGSYEYFEKSVLVGDDVLSKVDAGSSFETKYTDVYYWKKKDYQGLLANFPKSKFAVEARSLLDEEIWNKSKGKGVEGLRGYLKEYPKGKHVTEASTLIPQLEAEARRLENEAMRQKAELQAEAERQQFSKQQALLSFLSHWTKDANIARNKMPWSDAIDYVETLNKQQYGGYSDWRLPTHEEFSTLMQLVKAASGENKNLHKFLMGLGYNNVTYDDYWSSTTCDGNDGTNAYATNFYQGMANIHDWKKTHHYVWPTRSGQ